MNNKEIEKVIKNTLMDYVVTFGSEEHDMCNLYDCIIDSGKTKADAKFEIELITNEIMDNLARIESDADSKDFVDNMTLNLLDEYDKLEDWAIENHSHNEHVNDILGRIDEIRDDANRNIRIKLEERCQSQKEKCQ